MVPPHRGGFPARGHDGGRGQQGYRRCGRPDGLRPRCLVLRTEALRALAGELGHASAARRHASGRDRGRGIPSRRPPRRRGRPVRTGADLVDGRRIGIADADPRLPARDRHRLQPEGEVARRGRRGRRLVCAALGPQGPGLGRAPEVSDSRHLRRRVGLRPLRAVACRGERRHVARGRALAAFRGATGLARGRRGDHARRVDAGGPFGRAIRRGPCVESLTRRPDGRTHPPADAVVELPKPGRRSEGGPGRGRGGGRGARSGRASGRRRVARDEGLLRGRDDLRRRLLARRAPPGRGAVREPGRREGDPRLGSRERSEHGRGTSPRRRGGRCGRGDHPLLPGRPSRRREQPVHRSSAVRSAGGRGHGAVLPPRALACCRPSDTHRLRGSPAGRRGRPARPRWRGRVDGLLLPPLLFRRPRPDGDRRRRG